MGDGDDVDDGDDIKHLEAEMMNDQNEIGGDLDGGESSQIQEDMEKMLMKSGGSAGGAFGGGAKDLKNTLN